MPHVSLASNLTDSPVLARSSAAPAEEAWFAVWTRSRHESAVFQQLAGKGLQAFLPTVTRWSHWKDRKKRVDWPLFPGYCFARLDPAEALRVLSCSGVVSIVGFDGRPAPIADQEIESVRTLVETDLRFDPCPLIQEGDPVEVVRGPLRGVVGRLVRKGSQARLVLSVGLIGQGVTVDVDASDVRPSLAESPRRAAFERERKRPPCVSACSPRTRRRGGTVDAPSVTERAKLYLVASTSQIHDRMDTRFRHTFGAALFVVTAVAMGCSRTVHAPAAGTPTPVYNKTTGVLEQLVSDRNGDGKPDTWAYMDGTRIARIEIDRNGDGRPDRWEYYSAPPADGGPTTIVRADEANGTDGVTVTRHERYANGVLQTVDDDTDGDGRVDKWEFYEAGRLTRVELDLAGRGKPTQRLTYGADGTVATVETDRDGRGTFVPAPAAAGPAPPAGSAH